MKLYSEEYAYFCIHVKCKSINILYLYNIFIILIFNYLGGHFCPFEEDIFVPINFAGLEEREINKSKVIIDKEVGLDIIKNCGKKCFSTYWAIRSHKNKTYDSCYPSLKVLAEECDCSTKTIQRNISVLKEKGFLFATKGRSGKNAHYFFIKEPDIYTEEEIKKINKMINKINPVESVD